MLFVNANLIFMKATYNVVTVNGTVMQVFGNTATEKAKAFAYANKMTAASGIHRAKAYADTVTRSKAPKIGTNLF